MQIINLARKEYGDIDYDIITFPDGQKHIKIISILNPKDTIKIICRIKNGDDFFIVLQTADILQRHGIEFTLSIKYLFTARTDRVFSRNEAYSLKVIADIINNLDCYLEVFELHKGNIKYFNNWIKHFQNADQSDYIYCFPDEGAFNRYSNNPDSLICTKNRDPETGLLSNFQITNSKKFKGGNVIVLDDLCDGGGTFLGIASKLDELKPSRKILKIAHAIQKIGIEKVSKVYDEVIITNSFYDWDLEDLPDNVTVLDVLKK